MSVPVVIHDMMVRHATCQCVWHRVRRQGYKSRLLPLSSELRCVVVMYELCRKAVQSVHTWCAVAQSTETGYVHSVYTVCEYLAAATCCKLLSVAHWHQSVYMQRGAWCRMGWDTCVSCCHVCAA